MIPTLELGPLEFPSYFTLLTIGFMVAIWLAWRHAPALGVDQNRLLDVSLIALILGLLGSRLLHVIADGHWQTYVNLCLDPLAVEGKKLPYGWKCPTDYVCQVWGQGDLCHPDAGTCHPGRDCLRPFKLWYGGLAYYGGFLAAFVGCLWYIVKHKMRVWRVADLCTVGISIGLVFGRIGCFLAGCCFGRVTYSDFGVAFPKGSPAWRLHTEATENLRHFVQDLFPSSEAWHDVLHHGGVSRAVEHSLPVHPTQLYHVGANLLVFLIVYFIFLRRRTYDGKVLWWFLLLYGIARSAIEVLRNDNRGVWFGGLLSTSQLISVPLILGALYMMWRGHRSLKKKAEAGESRDAALPPA